MTPIASADRILARLGFLHELGHVADLRRRPPGAKTRYREDFAHILRYRQVVDWRRASSADGLRLDPAEQFAMGYSYCAENPDLIEPRVRDAFWGGSAD